MTVAIFLAGLLSAIAFAALAAHLDAQLHRARLERDHAKAQAASWQAIAEGRRALALVERGSAR